MTDFLRLHSNTANHIKLLTKPFKYLAHCLFVIEGRPHWGKKLSCLGGDCGFCSDRAYEGEFPDPRFIAGVMSLEDNKPYVLDMPDDVFYGLQALSRVPEWGDQTGRNVVLYGCLPDPRYMQVPHFSVIPMPDAPYEADDKMIEALRCELQELCKPSDADRKAIEDGDYDDVLRLYGRDCETN